MRVLLVNTSDNTGGAAVACHRLMEALTRNGVEVRMLVRDRGTGDSRITSVSAPWQKAVERVMLLPFVGFSWRCSWTIDTNWLGTDITQTEAFQWADVIHLHWVNQGFLSLSDIRRIVASGKRVVWTMHDLWPLSSIYHYNEADNTAQSSSRMLAWLERDTLRRKLKAYGNAGVHFVTCSRWLMHQVEDSLLLPGNSIVSIPNPIDTSLFNRTDKQDARKALGVPEDAKVVLFVSQKLTDERKGARYFVEAMRRIKDAFVLVLGSHGEEIISSVGVPGRSLGYVSDQKTIALAYNSADVFVLPSLNDNLPNTIMEAMACGVPCVGFDIGGIPEMIDHMKNGIIASPRDAGQLADGIRYCLDEANHQRLSDACIEKVAEAYSQRSVAERFKEVYDG